MYFRKRLIKSIYFTILYWNKIKYFHFILDIKAFIHKFSKYFYSIWEIKQFPNLSHSKFTFTLLEESFWRHHNVNVNLAAKCVFVYVFFLFQFNVTPSDI